MSITPANDVQPLTGAQASHARMISRLMQLQPKQIRGDADDVDLRNANDHLLTFAAIVDEYLYDFGREVAHRASGIDVGQFKDQLLGALVGNATFVLDQAAERVIAERRDGCGRVRHFNRA